MKTARSTAAGVPDGRSRHESARKRRPAEGLARRRADDPIRYRPPASRSASGIPEDVPKRSIQAVRREIACGRAWIHAASAVVVRRSGGVAWAVLCPAAARHERARHCLSRPLAEHAAAEHGLSQKAVEIAQPFGFPITNSMVVTWIVALGLIVFAQSRRANMSQVPSGRAELSGVARRKPLRAAREHHRRAPGRKTFWFFATIFIFILAANWIGLFPGVGTIGWGHQTAHGFVDRSAAVPRRQRRSQPDAGDGAGLLRVLDRLGASGDRPRRRRQGAVRAQGRNHRAC